MVRVQIILLSILIFYYSFESARLREWKGTCTLAIVMLNFLSDSELPGDVEGPFASRDVTSFYELWLAAQQIGNTCVMHYGRPGWAAEGMLYFLYQRY